jgi:hypothetical protein
MKMKKIPMILGVTMVAVLALGVTLNFSGTGKLTSTASGTYAANQIDTVNYTPEGVETALRFWIKAADSVSVTNVIVRRKMGTTILPPVAGDTIIGAFVATTNDTVVGGTVNYAPLVQTLIVRVAFAGSGQGVTSPNVNYFMVKKYR